MKYAVMALVALAMFVADASAAPRFQRVVVGRQRVVVQRRAVVVQRRAVVVPVRRAVVVQRQVVVGRRAAVVVQRRAIVVRRGVQIRRLRGALIVPSAYRAPVIQVANYNHDVEQVVVQRVVARPIQKVVVQQEVVEQDDCYGHCQTAAVRVARIVNGYRYGY